MRYLGRISYSIYLYQQLTVEIGDKLLAPYPLVIRLAGTVALTILVASGSFFLVERYFLLLKERFANASSAGRTGRTMNSPQREEAGPRVQLWPGMNDQVQ